MIRRIMPLLMTLLCVLLDTCVIPVFYSGLFVVPLTIILVFHIGILMGRMRGLLYGTIGGLLIDISAGTLGMMTFFFMAAGFLIGLLLDNPGVQVRSSRRNHRRRLIQRLVWIFALYAAGEIVFLVFQYFNTTMVTAANFIAILIRSLICTFACFLLHPVAKRILVGDKRKRTPTRNREVKNF